MKRKNFSLSTQSIIIFGEREKKLLHKKITGKLTLFKRRKDNYYSLTDVRSVCLSLTSGIVAI